MVAYKRAFMLCLYSLLACLCVSSLALTFKGTPDDKNIGKLTYIPRSWTSRIYNAFSWTSGLIDSITSIYDESLSTYSLSGSNMGQFLFFWGSKKRSDVTKEQSKFGRDDLNHNANRTRPVFGIIMATTRRAQDPMMYLVGNTSLKSIASQTYRRWHLFIGGDALSEEEVHLLHEQIRMAGLPRTRVHIVNIPYRESERALHSDPHDMWRHGGTAATNAAARLAYAHSSVTHVSLAGDDDVFLPNHLMTLAHGFNIADDVGFVHTRAYWRNVSVVNAFPGNKVKPPYKFQPPKPCALIAASSCWSKRYLNNTYERSKAEQEAPGALKRMPKNPCKSLKTLPNDADLWDRIWRMIEIDKKFRGVYIPIITIDYFTREYKTASVFPRLYGNAP